MYKIPNDIVLSHNFRLSEFVCHDDSKEVLFNMFLINKLQSMRIMTSLPITILSGYRTRSYNAAIKGSPKSQHLYGLAADIHIVNLSPASIASYAYRVGFTGIGIYTHNGNSFVHCDIRPKPTFWIDAENADCKSITGQQLMTIINAPPKK